MKSVSELTDQEFRKYILEYKENIPVYLSILSQLIDLSLPEELTQKFTAEFAKVQFHQQQLEDVDNLVAGHQLGMSLLTDDSLINANLVRRLAEANKIKPDLAANAEWFKIKLGNFFLENKSQIAQAAITGGAALFVALSSMAFQSDASKTEDLDIASMIGSSLSLSEYRFPSLVKDTLFSSANAALVASSAISSVVDVNQLLNQLLALAVLRSSPQSLPAYLSLIGFKMVVLDADVAQAAKPGKVIYCGPAVDCDHLIKTSNANGFELQQFDDKKTVSGQAGEVESLIINAHSDHYAMMELSGGKFEQPDDFVAKHFPKAKVIHIVGCSVGENPLRDFSLNSLAPKQLMFIHSGANNVVDMNTMVSLISGLLFPEFPSPVPTTIIFKKDATKSEFISISPPSYFDIKKIIDGKSADKYQELFAFLEKHFATQKAQALKKFEGEEAIKSIAEIELEKVGFIDHSKFTTKQKAQLVTNYLSSMLISFEISSEQKVALIQSGLVNVNYQVSSGATPLIISSKMGDIKTVAALISQPGINPNLTNEKGATALFTATERGDEKMMDLLLSHPDINPDIAIHVGETPLSIATSLGKKEAVKKILAKSKDPNIPRDDGVIPLYIAVQMGRDDIVDEFLKHPNIDLNREVKGVASPLFLAISLKRFSLALKLIEHGADPHLMVKNQMGENNAFDIFKHFSAKSSAKSVDFPKDFPEKMEAAKQRFLEKQEQCPAPHDPSKASATHVGETPGLVQGND